MRIRLMRYWVHMCWIDARTAPAQVVQNSAIWNGADKTFEYDSVSSAFASRLILRSAIPVPGKAITCPVPTVTSEFFTVWSIKVNATQQRHTQKRNFAVVLPEAGFCRSAPRTFIAAITGVRVTLDEIKQLTASYVRQRGFDFVRHGETLFA